MLFICLTTKRAVGVFWYTHFFVANDRHFFHHFQIFPSFSLLVSIFFVILYPCISVQFAQSMIDSRFRKANRLNK